MGYYPNIASDARAWRAKVDPQQRPRRRPAYIIISKRQQPQIYPGRSLRGLPVALITTTRKHALPWCYRVTLMVLGFFFFFFFSSFFPPSLPLCFSKPLGSGLAGGEPGAGRGALGLRHIDRQTINTIFRVVSCFMSDVWAWFSSVSGFR